MTTLKIDGKIFSISFNKKHIATLVIKTNKLFSSDVDRMCISQEPVDVNIDIELTEKDSTRNAIVK